MFRKVISKAAVASAIALSATQMNVEAATTYDVPNDSEFKTWMDYRGITSPTSEQYKLQQKAITNNTGFRIYDGRYCIALGTAFNALTGTYADVILTDGSVIHCIVGDVKRDCDTDWTNMQVAGNGNVVEFITDRNVRPAETTSRGTMSILPGFEAGVDYITIFDSEEEANSNYTPEDTTGKCLDKYTVEVGDDVFYFITYDTGETSETISCDEITYDSATIGQTL